MSHKLPDLPYPYNALEPFIDERTMEIHHGRHHAAYTEKFNVALDKHPELFEKPAEKLLKDLSQVPEDIRTSVRNNGGGYFNHSFFWKIMAPNAGGEPKGALAEAIKASFGSFEAFRTQFSDAGGTLFGSGWAWLVKKDDGTLAIVACPNQDIPFAEGKLLMNLDVWEHAYYLNYQNRRADYINAWWSVVNWDEVAKNFEA